MACAKSHNACINFPNILRMRVLKKAQFRLKKGHAMLPKTKLVSLVCYSKSNCTSLFLCFVVVIVKAAN